AALGGRLQPAHLEDQLAVAVVEEGELRVGGFAVVAGAEAPAQAQDRAGQLVLAQAPAGHVHLVDALVAQVAVAEVPVPVPAVMRQVLVVGPLRRRAQPQVEIQVARRINPAHRGHPAHGIVATFVTQAPGDLNRAQAAGAEEVDGLADPAAGADLRAGLADAVVPPGRFDDAPALADVVADGLLDVDVLAGLEGPDGGQGVPVVGRGDADDVDVAVLHDPAQILDERGPAVLSPLDGLLGAAGDGGIDVADVGDGAVEFAVDKSADVIHSAAVDADDGHVEPLASAPLRGLAGGRVGLVAGEVYAGRGGGEQRRSLEEFAPRE